MIKHSTELKNNNLLVNKLYSLNQTISHCNQPALTFGPRLEFEIVAKELLVMSSSLRVMLVSVEISRLASVSMETLDSRLLLVTFVRVDCCEARE